MSTNFSFVILYFFETSVILLSILYFKQMFFFSKKFTLYNIAKYAEVMNVFIFLISKIFYFEFFYFPRKMKKNNNNKLFYYCYGAKF